MTEKTKVVMCNATITGPKVGYRVVAWRRDCRVKVRVPADVPDWRVRCRHHPSRDSWKKGEK